MLLCCCLFAAYFDHETQNKKRMCVQFLQGQHSASLYLLGPDLMVQTGGLMLNGFGFNVCKWLCHPCGELCVAGHRLETNGMS